jgi:hypothetical protein
MNYSSLLFLLLLISCRPSANKDETTEKPTGAAEDIELLQIEEWPIEIDGCACYSAMSIDEFNKREYIYLDDYLLESAFLNIKGQLEKFEFEKRSSYSDLNHYKKYWKNEKYNLTIETKQIGQVDETWQHEGVLILIANKDTLINQEIHGECGC